MADIVFANNASALLAASIGTGDTSIQVAAGFGLLFPTPGGGTYFHATLEDNAGNIEIVKCTARTTDILTVSRAQEGTLAQAFTLNVTRVELRLTKAVCDEFAQISGYTATGNIDLNTNSLIDAYISGPSTRITQGQIIAVPLRGLVDISTNEIAVPTDGTSRATAGGAALLAAGDDIVAELDTAGVITLDSGTVGTVVPAGAYFRVEGATPANHMNAVHNDTDFFFTFPNTTEVNWDTPLSMAAEVRMNDNDLVRANILDFTVSGQTATSATTLNIDYELGSYVILSMTSNITDLNITNPPTTNVGTVRLKVVQTGAGSFTIANYPTGIKWARGVVPVLSTATGSIDYIDLWTDDGGTTWNGSFDTGWA